MAPLQEAAPNQWTSSNFLKEGCMLDPHQLYRLILKFFEDANYSRNYRVYGRFGKVFFQNNRWWTKSRNIVIYQPYNPLELCVICWFEFITYFMFSKKLCYIVIFTRKAIVLGEFCFYIYHYNVTYILFLPTSARGRHWTPKRGDETEFCSTLQATLWVDIDTYPTHWVIELWAKDVGGELRHVYSPPSLSNTGNPSTLLAFSIFTPHAPWVILVPQFGTDITYTHKPDLLSGFLASILHRCSIY
jgi:hypothetical protein